MIKWICAIGVVVILIKTGSIGKCLKFLLRVLFQPFLFAILLSIVGYVVADKLGFCIGIIAGAIIAWVRIAKKTKQDIKEP